MQDCCSRSRPSPPRRTIPTKTGRIVIPFPPGAINDTIGRIVATQLTARLGKQFIVDNRPGAGGIIAYELVANAPKDGHTLLIVSSAMTVAPSMHKTLPFDTVKSFAPIAMIAAAPVVVAANQNLPAKTAGELIALAKKQPGKLQYASSGVGTFLHLAGELFKLTGGVDILHIPFKGAGPAMTDVIGGHTQLVFASIGSTITHLRSGKLKAIGVGSEQRNPPDPGRSDGRRIRTAWLRRLQLVRDRRAGRHAAGHRCTAAQGDLGNPEQRRNAEAVRQRRRRNRADELGGVRRASSCPKWPNGDAS